MALTREENAQLTRVGPGTPAGEIDEHPLVFPNILPQGYSTQIRVPMDDTHKGLDPWA